MARWREEHVALALNLYGLITQLKSGVSFGLTGFIASDCAFNERLGWNAR